MISDSQLKAALIEQKKWGGRLGRTVVELGFTTEETMVKVLAGQLSLPIIDLDLAFFPDRVVEHLRLDLAERYGVFPLKVDLEKQSLSVATSDPTNTEALRALALSTSFIIQPTVASASSIDRAIRRYYFGEFPSGSMPAVPVSAPAPVPLPARASAPTPPVAEAPASDLDQTAYELDELLGEIPPRPPTSAPQRAPASEVELALRRELSSLREKVDSLETVNASQVRALRGLLELLIESGLIARDEYVQKLHRPD